MKPRVISSLLGKYEVITQLESAEDKMAVIVQLFQNRTIGVERLYWLVLNKKICPDIINILACKLYNGEDKLDKLYLKDKDKNRAIFDLLCIAAEQNDPWAQRNLGFLYLEGIGVEKHLAEAIKWLKKAIKQLKISPEIKSHPEFDFYNLLDEAYRDRDNIIQKHRGQIDILPKVLDAIYEKLGSNNDYLVKLFLIDNKEDSKNIAHDLSPDRIATEVSNTLDSYVATPDDAQVPGSSSDKKLNIVTSACKKEFTRQLQTEKHFFSPHRTMKEETKALAHIIQDNRLLDKAFNPEPLKVDHIPTRRLITAELSVMEASLRVFSRPASDTAELGYTCVKTISYKIPYKSKWDIIQQGCKEEVVIGNNIGNNSIFYRQKIHPHNNHIGDYGMESLGTYAEIYKTISNITKKDEDGNGTRENEQALAKLMLRYSREGRPISNTKLKQIKNDLQPNDVIDINRIFYHCFVKEIARWKLTKEPSHEFPLALAQIRAVKLIAEGHLSMADVFSQDADYGVFTGKEIGKPEGQKNLRKKIDRINRLYLEVFLKHNDDAADPENFKKYIAFFKSHKDHALVTTRTELHRELQEGYGSGSDTDGEGYDSETADELYPTGYSPL